MPLGDTETLIATRSKSTIECPNPATDAVPCKMPKDSICLFNIVEDPCELNNVAPKNVEKVALLEQLLHIYQASEVPRLNKPADPRGDPKFFNSTWTNWLDYYDPEGTEDLKFVGRARPRYNDAKIQKMVDGMLNL